MKIKCDVCDKDEASVFCTADEAALCNACDHRVHHANKLASEHQRFSLLHPSSKQIPLCDICKKRRAFLFCQQDRAILCRECDIPIHTANEHTKKHNRFLLTGVKLSSTSAAYISSSVSNVSDPKLNKKNTISGNSAMSNPVLNAKTAALATTAVNGSVYSELTTQGDGSTSSISDYLIETIPGWHVEDLLDSSDAFGICKNDDTMSRFLDTDFGTHMHSFLTENPEIWVPQAPHKSQPSQVSSQVNGQVGVNYARSFTSIKTNQSWSEDGFTVPQTNSPSTGKRQRSYWYN